MEWKRLEKKKLKENGNLLVDWMEASDSESKLAVGWKKEVGFRWTK